MRDLHRAVSSFLCFLPLLLICKFHVTAPSPQHPPSSSEPRSLTLQIPILALPSHVEEREGDTFLLLPPLWWYASGRGSSLHDPTSPGQPLPGLQPHWPAGVHFPLPTAASLWVPLPLLCFLFPLPTAPHIVPASC